MQGDIGLRIFDSASRCTKNTKDLQEMVELKAVLQICSGVPFKRFEKIKKAITHGDSDTSRQVPFWPHQQTYRGAAEESLL